MFDLFATIFDKLGKRYSQKTFCPLISCFEVLYPPPPPFLNSTCPKNRRLTKKADMIMLTAPKRNIITKSADFPRKLK